MQIYIFECNDNEFFLPIRKNIAIAILSDIDIRAVMENYYLCESSLYIHKMDGKFFGILNVSIIPIQLTSIFVKYRFSHWNKAGKIKEKDREKNEAIL